MIDFSFSGCPYFSMYYPFITSILPNPALAVTVIISPQLRMQKSSTTVTRLRFWTMKIGKNTILSWSLRSKCFFYTFLFFATLWCRSTNCFNTKTNTILFFLNTTTKQISFFKLQEKSNIFIRKTTLYWKWTVFFSMKFTLSLSLAFRWTKSQESKTKIKLNCKKKSKYT